MLDGALSDTVSNFPVDIQVSLPILWSLYLFNLRLMSLLLRAFLIAYFSLAEMFVVESLVLSPISVSLVLDTTHTSFLF